MKSFPEYIQEAKSTTRIIEKVLQRNTESGMKLLKKKLGVSTAEANKIRSTIKSEAQKKAKELKMEFRLDDGNFHGMILKVTAHNDSVENQWLSQTADAVSKKIKV